RARVRIGYPGRIGSRGNIVTSIAADRAGPSDSAIASTNPVSRLCLSEYESTPIGNRAKPKLRWKDQVHGQFESGAPRTVPGRIQEVPAKVLSSKAPTILKKPKPFDILARHRPTALVIHMIAQESLLPRRKATRRLPVPRLWNPLASEV